MSIPLMLPPIFWGVAAFTPTRAPDVTAIMHELAMLTFVTTDQYYIFMWVAIALVALLPNTVAYTPFPRWFGYYTAWTALMFEAGAVAFLTRSGPFAWNGLLAFWSPVVTFFAWMIVLAVLLFKAIASQDEARSATLTLIDENQKVAFGYRPCSPLTRGCIETAVGSFARRHRRWHPGRGCRCAAAGYRVPGRRCPVLRRRCR